MMVRTISRRTLATNSMINDALHACCWSFCSKGDGAGGEIYAHGAVCTRCDACARVDIRLRAAHCAVGSSVYRQAAGRRDVHVDDDVTREGS